MAVKGGPSGAGYQVPGFSKGLRLIELLCAARQPLGVSELSQQLGLNKPMVFRLLRTLLAAGWVVQDGEGPKYRMSLVPFHHASKVVQQMDLVRAASGPLEQLWTETGESVGVAVLDRDQLMYVLHHSGTRDVAIAGRVGARYYLHASAPGKVLLAYADEEIRRPLLRGKLPAVTDKTVRDPEQLREELARVRRQGYALDNQEYAAGGLCYAVPIFDHAHQVVAALNVSVLTLHYNLRQLVDDLGPRLQATERVISRSLGAPPA